MVTWENSSIWMMNTRREEVRKRGSEGTQKGGNKDREDKTKVKKPPGDGRKECQW